MTEDPPPSDRRTLTSDERALLNGFLVAEFDGVAALRVQAGQVLASSGCTCGCGTIDLHVPSDAPRSSSRRRMPLEREVVGAEGQPIGGLLLFLDDGWLSLLEVYSFGEPLLLPPPHRVRW